MIATLAAAMASTPTLAAESSEQVLAAEPAEQVLAAQAGRPASSAETAEASGARTPVASTPSSASAEAAPAQAVGRPERPAEATREDTFARLEWTWLGAGATAFAGTAALLTALDARGLEQDLHDRLQAARTAPETGAAVVGLARQAKDQAVLANVLWGVTGAAAVTTAILFHLETRPAPRLVVAPTGLGLAVAGRF